VRIIDRAYDETDKYLKNNNRYITATHIITGAILEAQYLSVELMKNRDKTPENAAIFEKIYNNKLYVQNLISLMEEIKGDPDTGKLLTQFKDLQKIYDTIKSAEDVNKESMSKLSSELGKIRRGVIS
jgi:ABC-type phosphate transport system auxiliary subunit